MKTIIIECKQYDEWDEQTQQKILEKYLYINTDRDPWWEQLYEEFADDLKAYGFDVMDNHRYAIHFSLFSAGSGAMFEGRVVDKDKFLSKFPIDQRIKKLITSENIEFSLQVEHNRGMYYHENSGNLILDLYPTRWGKDFPNITKHLDKLEQDIKSWYKHTCKKLFEDLEEEYWWLSEKEQIINTFRIYEFEFDSEGKIWNV